MAFHEATAQIKDCRCEGEAAKETIDLLECRFHTLGPG